MVKKHVSAPFQIITFFIALFIFALLLAIPIMRHTSWDRKPSLMPGSPAGSNPSIVYTGLQINSFSKTDILKNDFIFEGNLWFEYDPAKVTLEDLAHFDVDHGQVIERSTALVKDHGSKKIAQYFIRVNFKTNLNFKAFPLDNHTIYIVITNRFLSADKVIFKAADTNALQVAQIAALCSQEKTSVESGYVTANLATATDVVDEANPQIIFGIGCDRIDLRHFINIFIPLLIIFFFSLFAFSFDFKVHGETIPSLAAAGVPAILAYRFVIESLSPDVDYFMLSDYIFLLFLILVFIIFIVITQEIDATENRKKMTIIALYATMLLSCGSLFYWIV